MIKAIFFDWFNTLAHYYPPREELECQALKEMGLSVPMKIISRGLYLADKNFYEENARLPIRNRAPNEQLNMQLSYQVIILKEANIQPEQNLVVSLAHRLRELNPTMKFVLYEDVVPTLKSVKAKKLTTGLISNLQRSIDEMCRELGITQYIDFSVTSGEVGEDKPKPRIFLRALELAKVEPNEAILVGDQYENDILGAQGVGITGVLLDRLNLYGDIKDCPRIQTLTEVVKYLS